MLKYHVDIWTPPKLSPEQEIAIGRVIARVGREKFMKLLPYLPEHQRRLVRPPKFDIAEIVAILFGVGLLFLSVIAPSVLIGGAVVFAYSMGTLWLTRSAYNTWADEMLAKFRAHIAASRPGIMTSEQVAALRRRRGNKRPSAE
jgi:hypothetical protein